MPEFYHMCRHFCTKCVDKRGQIKMRKVFVWYAIKSLKFLKVVQLLCQKRMLCVEKLLEVKKPSNTLLQNEWSLTWCEDNQVRKENDRKVTVCREDLSEYMYKKILRIVRSSDFQEFTNDQTRQWNEYEWTATSVWKTCRWVSRHLVFYCTVPVCIMCYACYCHSLHKCSDIKEVAEGLSKQMIGNAKRSTVSLQNAKLCWRILQRVGIQCGKKWLRLRWWFLKEQRNWSS